MVNESADSPAHVTYTFEVDCSAGEMREYSVFTTYFDASFETTPTDHVWGQAFFAPEQLSWQRRVMEFTCHPEMRTAEYGMLYMGGTEIHPTYLAWKLWPDGPNLDIDSGKSFEELKAENETAFAALDRQMESARTSLGGELSAQDQAGQRRQARMDRWPRRGVWRDFYMNIMEPHIGFTEANLFARWGQPSRIVERPGMRLAVYEQGYDEVMTGNRGVLGHGEISRAQHRCILTFAIQNGKVIDYGAQGEYCLKVHSN